jgi:ribosomal protein S12 methylthiotransferase
LTTPTGFHNLHAVARSALLERDSGLTTTCRPTVHLVSLGCARNQVDSETMLGRLTAEGWAVVADPAVADAIVINTCSFIEDAANESIDAILEMAAFKRTGRCRRLIVTGCLPERYREEIVVALPEVDRFLGTGAFDQIGRIMGRSDADFPVCYLPDPDAIVPGPADAIRWRSPAPSAYLKIAEGCSRRCTYCIIPKLRGRQKSIPPERLKAEARRLAAEGVRELVLVAQDTTAYGKDLNPAFHLADLLHRLAAALPDVWLRLLYGHPESIDDHIVETVGALENVCAYFDLPIQHASDRILRRMGRQYTAESLRRRFEGIRRRVPEASLRTTAIVGFPGEDEADFDRLMAFIEEIGFDHLGAFVYSDHQDLPSHQLSHHVPAATARRRYRRLMDRQREISADRNRRHLGRTYPVLIEAAPESGLFEGRSMFQAPEVDGITYVRGKGIEVGQVCPVLVEDTLEYDLTGALR